MADRIWYTAISVFDSCTHISSILREGSAGMSPDACSFCFVLRSISGFIIKLSRRCPSMLSFRFFFHCWRS
uniref:FI24701p1 n=1 Tax=Drosophila melanogaster TaxID=7227 RepID=A0A0H4Y1N1_DROME|nr:FI24701p1 [Drosophila melanogaster]